MVVLRLRLDLVAAGFLWQAVPILIVRRASPAYDPARAICEWPWTAYASWESVRSDARVLSRAPTELQTWNSTVV